MKTKIKKTDKIEMSIQKEIDRLLTFCDEENKDYRIGSIRFSGKYIKITFPDKVNMFLIRRLGDMGLRINSISHNSTEGIIMVLAYSELLERLAQDGN